MTRWRIALGTHPTWPVIGLIGVVWSMMVHDAILARRFACCDADASAAVELGAWCEMVVAMMLPTVLAAMRDVAARSYRARRPRAVALYGLGYVVPWLIVGIAGIAVKVAVGGAWWLATASCGAGLAWIALPQRERWHRACHRRIVLRPVGRLADVDAVRQGTVHAIPCIAMCWPVMLACAATDHDLVVMALGAWLAWFEKRMFRLHRLPLVIATTALLAWTLVRA